MKKIAQRWMAAGLTAVSISTGAGAANQHGASAPPAQHGGYVMPRHGTAVVVPRHSAAAQRSAAISMSTTEIMSGKLTLATNLAGDVTNITITVKDGLVYRINTDDVTQPMARLKPLADKVVHVKGQVRKEFNGGKRLVIYGDILPGAVANDRRTQMGIRQSTDLRR